MVSRLSRTNWHPAEAIRKFYTLAVVAPEPPLARLLSQTGVPELHGTPRDKAVELLQMAAEVEHAFVVQYLYAAFSLRNDDPNGAAWYRTIFGIAKEEMGHLVTVQNLLLLLGDRPYLNRQSYPAPASYPFEKFLKPFGLGWLGGFVIAESPMDAKLPPGLQPTPNALKVGTIYAYLYWLFKDSEQPGQPWPIANPGLPPEHLAESDFADPTALADRLMTPEDWGVPSEQPGLPMAGLRILAHGPFDTKQRAREGALNALYDVAAQGEGPIPQMNSHFERLSKIYIEAGSGASLPLKNIPDNPHSRAAGTGNPEQETGLITHPTARRLAKLLNLRYGMLLTEIAHIAQTPRDVVAAGEVVRQKLTEWAIYKEMAFIHQLSDAMNTQPLKATRTADSDLKASAPFELPDELPAGDQDSWESYLDVMDRTKEIVTQIGSAVPDLGAIPQADDDRRAFVADRLR